MIALLGKHDIARASTPLDQFPNEFDASNPSCSSSEQSYDVAEQDKGRGPALRAPSGVTFLYYLGSEVTILFLALV